MLGWNFLLTGAIFGYMWFSAVACSRIAERKGRGADEWFVCGEILGLIAVIPVLLLPPLITRSHVDGS